MATNLAPAVASFFSSAALFKLLDDAVAVRDNIPRPLDPAFYEESTSNEPVGTQVSFYRHTNNRAAAKASSPGAPSKSITSLPGSEAVTMTGVLARENYDVSQDLIEGLKSGMPWFVNRAGIELKRNAMNARGRLELFKADQIHSIWANSGKIYVATDGTIMDSATTPSGLTLGFTIDMKLGAANIVSPTTSNGSTAIGDWATTSTDIGKYIRLLDQAAILATGYPLDTIYYGVNVPGYLAANTTLAKYAFNPLLNKSVAELNEIPDGVLGKRWKPVYQAFSGNGTNWFPADYVGFSPIPSKEWYECVPFGQLVPATGVASNLITENTDAVTGNMGIVKYGMFSYSYHNPDPYQMRVVNGYGCLPALKVPKSIYVGLCH